MEENEAVFKPPALPSSTPTTPTSPVVFKMPQSKKLSADPVSSTEIKSDIPVAKDDNQKRPIISAIPKEMAGKEQNPARSTKSAAIESDYKAPVWSGPCTTGTYDLDILKDGRIIGNIALATLGDDQDQNKPYYIFGRQGDIVVEHPSISRHHAVIQYRALGNPHELGWYLYDMGSTHGTFLNKEKLPPFMHVPVRVGHMFKLGFSTRMYILNGPEEDREPESNMTITELKEQAHKQKLLMSKRREPAPASIKDESEPEKKEELSEDSTGESASTKDVADEGISWGMSEDYGEEEEKEKEKEVEETAETGESAMESIEEVQKREQLYIDDPKKALKNFFDRQGCEDEMNFEFTERGAGARHQWTCRIELPIETETGRPVFAEATVSGGKKEAIVACALEACRLLDAAGLLRKSNQESKKRKSKEWADNDFYDSDEDTFLDRTGEVERKRAKRMRQAIEADSAAGAGKSGVETYDSLSEKLRDVNTEIERVQQQIDLIRAEAAQAEAQKSSEPASARDSLDAYMASMSRRDAQEAKVQQSRLRLKLIELKKSAERLEKLVKLAKPTSLPPITIKKSLDTVKKQPILIGTMKGHRMRKLIPAPEKEKEEEEKPLQSQQGLKEEDVIEMEEEEEAGSTTMLKTETSRVSTAKDEKPEVAKPAPVTKTISAEPPPPPVSEPNDEKMEVEASAAKPPSKRSQQKKNKNKPQAAQKEDFGDYDPADVNYATWLPPENQSGDGRTSLNEKFGY